MIDIKKLTEAKRVEVTFASVEIDGDFVKRFRKENNLTQVALSNILGVKKKTIEKWEQGVNKVSGSSAVLLMLLNDDKELLNKVYSVHVCISGEKSKKEFMPIYTMKTQTITLIKNPILPINTMSATVVAS